MGPILSNFRKFAVFSLFWCEFTCEDGCLTCVLVHHQCAIVECYRQCKWENARVNDVIGDVAKIQVRNVWGSLI